MGTPLDNNPLGIPERIEGLASFEAEFARALGVMRDNPELAAAVGKKLVGNPISIEIVPSAQKWAAKQIRNAEAAAGDWLDGVRNPSGSPTANAKRAAGKYKQRMTESLSEDRWLKAMNMVTDEDIIAVVEAIGSGAYTAGITARKGKIQKAVDALQPKVAALKQVLDSMPQDNDAQREAKMLAAKRGMQKIGRELRGITGG